MFFSSIFDIRILIIQSYANVISNMDNITSLELLYHQNMINKYGLITDTGIKYFEWILNNNKGYVCPLLINQYKGDLHD